MIKLDLWDVINTRVPHERDIPESLEKLENPVGNKAEASKAEDGRNDTAPDPSQHRD